MTSGGREKSFASWDQSAGGGGGGRSSGSFELGTSFSQDHLGLAWRTCVEYEGGMWSLVYIWWPEKVFYTIFAEASLHMQSMQGPLIC